MKKMIFLLAAFVSFFSFLKAVPFFSPNRIKTVVLYSDYTEKHKPDPIFFDWEMKGVLQTLNSLHVSYKVLHDSQFNLKTLKSYRLLILPDTMDMTKKEVLAVKSFVKNGGKVLATEFASLRNKKDQSASGSDDFQLASLFGVDFLSYNADPPEAGCLKLVKKLGGTILQLGRNHAVYVQTQRGDRILAHWVNDNKKTFSLPKRLDAALVENKQKTAIYSGEDLFNPQNSNSQIIQELIADLMNHLVPGVARFASKFTGVYPHLPYLGYFPEIQGSERKIQVGFPYSIRSGYITCDAPFYIENGKKEVFFNARSNWKIAFQAVPHGFMVSGRDGSRFYFVPSNPAFPLKVVLWHGDRIPDSAFKFLAVRGSLILKDLHGKRVLVNALPLKDYLAGVIPHEVPFYFSKQALETMAVVARTFALREIEKRKFKGYDICSTPLCQTYSGLAYESASSRNAVSATQGKVLVYHGKLAYLPYFSTCGGITEAIQNVWNVPPVPYLKSIVDGPEPIRENLSASQGVKQFLLRPPDSYCKNSSRFRWKQTYSVNELESLFRRSLPLLLKRKVKLGIIKGLKVLQRSTAGRVMDLQIKTSHGVYNVYKDKIRWLFSEGEVGLGGLPSTLFVMKENRGIHGLLRSVTFIGGGWGHGVGLCQYGAEGMAQKGFSYQKILQHYYPGTNLVNETWP
jgi:SpoIID/LytB domain protein